LTFLNLYKGAEFSVIPDFTIILVDKAKDAHIPARLDIRRNTLDGLIGQTYSQRFNDRCRSEQF